MKEPALVIIKPDGISRGLIGHILTKFSAAKLEIVGIRIAKVNRAIAEEHYQHIKGLPFFQDTINYFLGKYHKQNKLITIVYYGENAIKKCRKIVGATNPEEAAVGTIRASYGRISTRGTFENVVHVSSTKKEARREIRLWFRPEDLMVKIYATKLVDCEKGKERVWA